MKTNLTFIFILLHLITCNIFSQEIKLTAFDGATEDRFGYKVSMSENYCIVGANRDDDNGDMSGSAYIYIKNGSTWIFNTKIIASDANGGNFGSSVFITDEFAIVGAPGDTVNGKSSGSAYIFKREGDLWEEQAKIIPSNGAAKDVFGTSVSLFGEYAVVGAYGNQVNGDYSGCAYIFKRNGAIWTEDYILVPDDGMPFDQFGFSVSIYSDDILVGSPGSDESGPMSGSVYYFKKNGASWSLEAKFVGADTQAGDLFGDCVYIKNTSAIIGATFDDDNGYDSGSAYVFQKSGNIWIEEAKLLASNSGEYDYFGFSASIDGNYAIVGAQGNNVNGQEYAGSCYIYEKSADSWNEKLILNASDGVEHDFFGFSVALHDQFALVGAPYRDDLGENSGAAYLYELEDYLYFQESSQLSHSYFSIYPNPADNEIHIVNKSMELIDNITVYDYNGKILIKEEGNIELIDVSKIEKGIYILKITSEKLIAFKKIIII